MGFPELTFSTFIGFEKVFPHKGLRQVWLWLSAESSLFFFVG
jgi:hypothetical protein